jgi:hypothetical protein
MPTPIEYEVFLSIRARKGNAVTGDLLPQLMLMKSPELILALFHSQLCLSSEFEGSLAIDPVEMMKLSEKIEQDIKDNKYKWQINIEVDE